MIKKDFLLLSDDAKLRLLALKRGFCIVSYGEPDEEVQKLVDDGFIRYVKNSMFYEFTEEGRELTDKFWNEYTKIIKEEVEKQGESFSTYIYLVKNTNLSYRVIGELARYLNIRFIP